MNFGMQFDRAAILKEADRQTRLVLRGALDGVKEETRGLEQDLEKITRLAVPGTLYKGWQSQTLKKIAREPAGWVYFNHGPRSQGAIAYWTQPGRISRGGGRYLAVPTKAAGPRVFGRGRASVLNTPKEWERRSGVKLKFRPRQNGKNPVLVLEKGSLTPKTGRGKQASKRAIKKGEAVSIVMFVLIPFTDQANAIAVEPVIERRRVRFPDTVERTVKASLARN
jgi:hypothetical protein